MNPEGPRDVVRLIAEVEPLIVHIERVPGGWRVRSSKFGVTARMVTRFNCFSEQNG
jgi:hypothetical protein